MTRRRVSLAPASSTNNSTALAPATAGAMNAYAMTRLGDVMATQDYVRRFRARKGLAALPDRCDRCRNTGYIGYGYCSCGWAARRQERDMAEAQRLEEAKQAAHRLKLEACLTLPKKHSAWSLDSHPLRGTKLHEAILLWLATWDGQQSLLLCGPVGTGKTGYLVGVMQALKERAVRARWRMRFLTMPEMFASVQAGFADHTSDGLVHEYSTVQVLGLDDLGAEYVTGWKREQLFTILNARHNASLPLLATTNCDLVALSKYLDARVYSRLMQNCMVFDVVGEDLRAPETPVEHAPWWTGD